MGLEALAVRMTAGFFHGPLRHLPLLAVVLGRQPAVEEAVLAGYRQVMAKDRALPTLVADAAAEVAGALARSLSGADLARLGYYLRESAPSSCALPVRPTRGGPQVVAIVCPAGLAGDDGRGTWSFADWQGRIGGAAVAAARTTMAAFGTERAALVASRHAMVMVRESARLRATAEPGRAETRQAAGAGAVVVHGLSEPYAKFFAVEEYDLSHRRFDGTMTPLLNRATFISAISCSSTGGRCCCAGNLVKRQWSTGTRRARALPDGNRFPRDEDCEWRKRCGCSAGRMERAGVCR